MLVEIGDRQLEVRQVFSFDGRLSKGYVCLEDIRLS